MHCHTTDLSYYILFFIFFDMSVAIPEMMPVLGSQPAGDRSHKPGGRLPLPSLTFPAAKHHRPLAGTKLYCLISEAHECDRLAQIRSHAQTGSGTYTLRQDEQYKKVTENQLLPYRSLRSIQILFLFARWQQLVLKFWTLKAFTCDLCPLNGVTVSFMSIFSFTPFISRLRVRHGD